VDTLTGCDPLSQSPSVPRGLDGRRRRRRGSTCSSARGCALQLVAAPQPPPQLRPVATTTTSRRRTEEAFPHGFHKIQGSIGGASFYSNCWERADPVLQDPSRNLGHGPSEVEHSDIVTYVTPSLNFTS
ncbi:unnamed protein product, partial [Urochloa humidicola]